MVPSWELQVGPCRCPASAGGRIEGGRGDQDNAHLRSLQCGDCELQRRSGSRVLLVRQSTAGVMSLKPKLTPAGREHVRKVVEALEALVQAKVSYDFADPRWRSGEHLNDMRDNLEDKLAGLIVTVRI